MTKQEPPRNRKVYDRSTQPLGPRLPPTPAATADEVWARIDTLVVSESAPTTPPVPTGGTERKREKRSEIRRTLRRRRAFRFLDVIAAVYWIAVLVKLFVADVDRAIVGLVAPEAMWILDLRWAVALTLVALILVMFRRGTVALSFVYVAVFPLVVIFWKVPRFFIKRRSPLLVGLAVTAVATAAMRARRVVCALAATVLSTLVIVLSNTNQLVGLAIVVLIVTLCWSVTVACLELLKSSKSLVAQRKIVEWVLENKHLEKLITPRRPNKVSIKDWTADEARGYRDSAGIALLVHEGARLWAAALEQFRRGPFVVMLNATAVLSLFVQVVFVFSFVTMGLVEIAPEQYLMLEAPTGWTYVYYAATSCWFGEIGALQPVGPLAMAAKTLNGAIGALGLGVIVVSILIGYRTVSSDGAADEVVALLDAKTEQLQDHVHHEYMLSMDDLRLRLAATAWGLAGVVEWIDGRVRKSTM